MSFKFDKVGKLTKIGARRHNWNDREFGLSLQHKSMWYFKTAQGRDDFIKTASDKGSSFDPSGKGAAQGIIPLTEGYAYSADYVETKEWSWCIELFTPGRYHYLCASSKDEMMEWIHLMCRCGVTFRSTRAISMPDDIKAKQLRAKHGFLLKRGELNTGFKKRLFRALTSANGEIRVEYFEGIHDDKPKGAIDMKEAKLVFEPNSLDIVIKTSNRNWVLRADDAKIREDWILYFEGKLTKEEQKEAEEKAAKEKAEREAKEAAEKAAREVAEAKAKAEREEEERRRKASEDRKAAEAAKRAEEEAETRRRKESEDRKEQERLAREKAEQEERDRQAAAEKAAQDKAASDKASKDAKAKADKDAADKVAKDKADKEARDRAEAEAKAKAAAAAPKTETKAAPVALPEAFTKGTKMIKVPRSGDPAESELKLEVGSDGDMRVTWASKKKKADEASMLLRTCTLVLGQTGGQFKERPKIRAKVADKNSLSFSLIGASRSLDLICNTSDDYRTWMRELTKHVAKVQNLAGLAFGA